MKLKSAMLSAALTALFPALGSAALVFDQNGAAAGGRIEGITGLNWNATSILAQGINCGSAGCSFTFLTHAKLESFATSSGDVALDAGRELTMVAKFSATLSDISMFSDAGIQSSAITFSVTDLVAGDFFELYLGDTATATATATANANDLTGHGFDDGQLILSAHGFTAADGQILLTDGVTPLDSNPPGNEYPDQQTRIGFGGIDGLGVNVNGAVIDQDYLAVGSIDAMRFASLLSNAQFSSVDPSDCFTNAASTVSVGVMDMDLACDNTHVAGKMSAQTAASTDAYVPNIGDINGAVTPSGLISPDLIMQIDGPFTMTVEASGNPLPAPGTLALLGIGLAALRLRRRAC